MGGWIAERYGNYEVKPGLLKYRYTGIAGQSFGAFATQGMELKLIGEANDYIGKGLSGGRLIVVPPKDASYDIENSPIVGNVSCFGANRGEAYFLGRVGAHGCEYMTGGVAVILGSTGRNFGAGMSGGVAYVYDPENKLAGNLNAEMVDLFKIGETSGDDVLKELVQKHLEYTGSNKAKNLLANWEAESQNFVKVYPTDFHKINDITEALETEGLTGDELLFQSFEVATTGKKATYVGGGK
jgi:glutamate synthase (NADPH/NADH) large chain